MLKDYLKKKALLNNPLTKNNPKSKFKKSKLKWRLQFQFNNQKLKKKSITKKGLKIKRRIFQKITARRLYLLFRNIKIKSDILQSRMISIFKSL